MAKLSNAVFYVLCKFQELFCLFFCEAHTSQSGEIVVSGQDSLEVILHKKPKCVKLYFKDDCNVTPCNPVHFDSLTYSIEKNVCKYILKIDWNVASIRTIVWHIHF
jgi:hypothetical protein